MIITEKDLGFTLIDALQKVDSKFWSIIDYKLYESSEMTNIKLSIGFDMKNLKNNMILDELKLDYVEYIKPYFIEAIENLDKLGIRYSDKIDIIYDVPEENMLYWRLKYQ